LASQDELQACVDLQRLTWGAEFAEVVPPSLLKITAKVGGVAAGAFTPEGELLGFVFGITGVERGTVVHWSHMLGVLPRAQNHGIGKKLKEYQRAEVARAGAKVIYWTFDPLVARNAHLNFNKLGVRATQYVRDMYGTGTSPLHRGIGTDRLIVAWPVAESDIAARREEMARFANNGVAEVTRIEIPTDIEALQTADMAQARTWRDTTRGKLEEAFASGLAIQGFHVDGMTRRSYYLLAR
jgi:predicted GNAT superfamily acetyltransferase